MEGLFNGEKVAEKPARSKPMIIIDDYSTIDSPTRK
jgi:hypothetical protein